MTTVSAALTYTIAISGEIVRIALTPAALNGLQIKVGGVENAYITAPVREKTWIILEPEHEEAGKKAIIVCALCGLKSSGAAFRAHLCECMYEIFGAKAIFG